MIRFYRQLAPTVRRNLLLLFGASFLFWCSMASLLPTLSLYVRHVGGNDSQVGLVMGSFAIGLLLSRGQLGRLADRRGRKVVLLLGAIVATIAPLGYLLVTSIPLLMLLRVFHGLSIAAFTTGYSALVVDLSPPEQRGETIGYMSLTQPIGVAIAPALGSYLQVAYGNTAMFFASASFGVAACCGLWLVREGERPPQSVHDRRDDRLWTRLANPAFGVPAAMMLAIGIVFGTISTFIPLLIVSEKIPLLPGLFYSTAAVSSFSLRFVSGRLGDRLGRGILVMVSTGFYGAAMAMIALARDVPWLLGAALLEGIAAGLFIPAILALVSDRAHPDELGRCFAVVLAGFDLGIALAGPGLGLVADRLGYPVLFGIGASLALGSGLLFATVSSSTPRRSLRFALGLDQDRYAIANQ